MNKIRKNILEQVREVEGLDKTIEALADIQMIDRRGVRENMATFATIEPKAIGDAALPQRIRATEQLVLEIRVRTMGISFDI